ncbi:arsenate reductase [Amylibacter sp.]|nr:arsenate reductase [Amylibacter sp.]
MKLFGLKNCDTCRKALKSLAAVGHDVTFIDVRADGVTPENLKVFHAKFGEALLNTRSTTWRGLDDAERAQEPLKLLIDHPALMKRLVIDHKGSLTLGWTKDVQSQLL